MSGAFLWLLILQQPQTSPISHHNFCPCFPVCTSILRDIEIISCRCLRETNKSIHLFYFLGDFILMLGSRQRKKWSQSVLSKQNSMLLMRGFIRREVSIPSPLPPPPPRSTRVAGCHRATCSLVKSREAEITRLPDGRAHFIPSCLGEMKLWGTYKWVQLGSALLQLHKLKLQLRRKKTLGLCLPLCTPSLSSLLHSLEPNLCT